jgi:hypothetical protein
MMKLRACALAAACAAAAPGVSHPAAAANAVRIPHMRSSPVITLRMLQIKALQHAYRLFTQSSLTGTTRAAQAKAYAAVRASYRSPVFLAARPGRSPKAVGNVYPPATTVSLLTFGRFGNEPAVARVVNLTYDNRTVHCWRLR